MERRVHIQGETILVGKVMGCVRIQARTLAPNSAFVYDASAPALCAFYGAPQRERYTEPGRKDAQS